MEKLDLSHNQLESVGSGAFRGLSRLRQLYLHNNRLTVVQQGSLDMLILRLGEGIVGRCGQMR